MYLLRPVTSEYELSAYTYHFRRFPTCKAGLRYNMISPTYTCACT